MDWEKFAGAFSSDDAMNCITQLFNQVEWREMRSLAKMLCRELSIADLEVLRDEFSEYITEMTSDD